jgi:glycosyltransferase involved in cell wall biosynthesis
VAQSIFFYTDSREIGGAEDALFTLMGALDPHQWKPTLLLDAAAGTDELADRSRALGVPSAFIPEMPLGPKGARRVPAMARMLRRERPAVFHAHLTSPMGAKYPLAAAVAARVRAVVATVHLIPPFTPDRSNLVQLRLLARLVGAYIAVSRDIAAGLAEDLRWPREKIDLIYNAVDSSRFGKPVPEALRASLMDGGDRPVVLTPARLHEQKGHTYLLRAAATLPGVVFAFAGEGPARAELETEAARLGVAERVRFLGQRNDIPDLLAAADLVAIPSLYEGSPIAVLEALAAERAVVGSAVGGMGELIEDGKTGILVPPGDVEALAAGLRRLVEDPAGRRAMGQRGRRRVDRDFGTAAMARQVEQVYERLLAP